MILAIKTATGIVGTVESVVSGQRTQTKQVGGQRLSRLIHKKVRIPTFSPLLPHQTRQNKTEFSFAPEAAYLGVPVDSKVGPSLNLIRPWTSPMVWAHQPRGTHHTAKDSARRVYHGADQTT